MLRMNEMPKAEVHIVSVTGSPSGIGEPSVPPIGPAASNLIFAAARKRARKLPPSTANWNCAEFGHLQVASINLHQDAGRECVIF